MERNTNSILRVGDWRVNPSTGEISRNGETARVEVRTMRLLLCLARRSGEVVSIEELLDEVWSGVVVSQDSVYQAVASLRRLLGDDPKQPIYIATVPRLGYRMVAPVSPWPDEAAFQTLPAGEAASASASPSLPAATDAKRRGNSRFKSPGVWAAGAALFLMCAFIFFLFHGRGANGDRGAQASLAFGPQKSIAVLAFLDLTPGMKEEEFADGLSEEIIDKLSKLPGFHVPAATASFYFKYKKISLAEIARNLGVVYVLDGSTRQSGNSVRIAARLVRAENGYVIWSETYDRPFVSRVAVQDEIAGEITKALRASIDGAPAQ
jgi:transcriptional activator of cad operon